jgi:hypothetical protein
VSVAVETARQHWEEGYRRFQELALDGAGRDRLQLELETLSGELRRRLGQKFTLAEAAELYRGAESWASEAFADAGTSWRRDLAVVLDAAFFLYARSAQDYLP